MVAVKEVKSERPLSPRNYYSRESMSEKLQLENARQVEGLADEIAMLRVRLKTAVEKHPEDLRLLSVGIGMLVKAVAAQYRLSPKAKKDLAESITAVLNSLGDQLLPADR